MARPQIEDGHTKVANEIAEALARVNLTSHENRVLWCILRKTYGWNKKADRISYSQFQDATGIDRRHIGRSLSSLKTRQIITCQGDGYSLEYGLQKDYELWDKFDTISGNEIDTMRGNDLPPSQAIGELEICHHPGDNLPPSGTELTPSGAMNLTPSQGTTKAIKHYTKALYKSKVGSGPYFEKIRQEFSDVTDFDTQVRNCEAWNDEHHPITANRHRLSALRNWLTKERKFKSEGDGHGAHRRDTEKRAATADEIEASIGKPPTG